MRTLFQSAVMLGLLASLLLGDIFVTACVAQSHRAPVYARRRAYRQSARMDYAWPNRNSRYVAQPQYYQGGYYGGYFPSRPMIMGSYYTRPYPQHFDVYSRGRYRAMPQPVVVQPPVVPEAEPAIAPHAEAPVPVESTTKK